VGTGRRHEVKEEEAGSWVKDILCWEAWDGANGMACASPGHGLWAKGSSGGRDAAANHSWHN
jgi:hypothetical protein